MSAGAGHVLHYHVSAIYSSDLSRAYATALIVAAKRELEVKAPPPLRERHDGTFQGLTAKEGAQRYPEAHARYMARDPD